MLPKHGGKRNHLQVLLVWVLSTWLFKCLDDILKREENPGERRVAAGRWHILILSRLILGTFIKESGLGF